MRLPGGRARTGPSAGLAPSGSTQPRQGQFDVREHAQLKAVILAFLRAGRVQVCRAFEFGSCVAFSTSDLQQRRTGQVNADSPGRSRTRRCSNAPAISARIVSASRCKWIVVRAGEAAVRRDCRAECAVR
jgi:hypothetical protein